MQKVTFQSINPPMEYKKKVTAQLGNSRKIVKLTSKDEIPVGAKFLYAKEEFQGMAGWVSNLNPVYKTIFYYEVDKDYQKV